MRHRFVKKTTLPYSPKTVFGYYNSPEALVRLTPPWEKMKVVKKLDSFEDGSRVVLKVKTGPIWQKWVAEHFDFEPPHLFCDRMVSGPFKYWVQRHEFRDVEAGCEVRDIINYELPVSPFSDMFGGWFAKSKIQSMFDYRHRITEGDVKYHETNKLEPKRILISGSSGMIGTQLVAYFSMAKHDVWKLKRVDSPSKESRDEKNKIIFWDPKSGFKNKNILEGFDVVIHLAGAGIADKRWTDARKKVLRESRVIDTNNLSKALAELDQKPEVFLSSSAIGIYGDRDDEKLTEESAPVDDFLGKLGQDWEKATQQAADAGIRTINMRTGIVLSPAGGALGKMILPFMMGVGGKLGDGKAYMSWIALDDMLSSIEYLIKDYSIEGPVNLTSPNPVTNSEFTKTLSKVIKRPAFIPAPEFGLNMMFGEMAEKALLASARVIPEKLNKDYQFRYADLESALRHLLGY